MVFELYRFNVWLCLYLVGDKRKMNEEELRIEATTTVEWECTPMIDRPTFINGYITSAKPREKRIAELEAQIEKMKCCKDEIIKALKETLDYEWLHAHNGKAKYLYLQTVIDIVNEKFEEIKEK